MNYTKVDYTVYTSAWSIREKLKELVSVPLLAFDLEARSMYTKEEIKEAEGLLDVLPIGSEDHKLCSVVSRSSGLSYPSIVKATHWLFGLDEHTAIIMIAHTDIEETMIANWVADYEGLLLIHRATFDLSIVYNRTNRLPKNIVDTQLMAKCLVNDVDILKARTGLKHLMGSYYPPQWGMYEDYDILDLKDKAFLEYCSYDVSATIKLYNMLQDLPNVEPISNTLRPYELLPVPLPATFDPAKEDAHYFYNNILSKFIPDTIKLMATGLTIDQEAVERLRETVTEVLGKVSVSLEGSPIIERYKAYVHPELVKLHREQVLQSLRTLDHYNVKFKSTNVVHRTFVVNSYLINILGKPDAVSDRWLIKGLKVLNKELNNRFLKSIIRGKANPDNEYVIEGMLDLAKFKLELWNRPRYLKAEEEVIVPPFNPSSPKQKQLLFKMLDISSDIKSKTTGEDSWDRDAITDLFNTTMDEDLKVVLQAFIDHSFSGIIKVNFLKAFDSFTLDGVLHGNINLFGAKSMRPTSQSPNLLNFPSTGSRYAKPLKECFVAPKGMLIYAIDFAALEDRVVANLSKDVNKLALFTKGLDGHSMSATYYFKDRVEEVIGKFTDNQEASILLKAEVSKKNLIAKQIRTDSKPVSFGLAYGAYPPKVAATIKCSLKEAERIFNAYHTELYPGITAYREEYVLETAKRLGHLHLGLGCKIYTDDADKDIRSVGNASVQFWSILTQIALNEMNYRIEEAGLQESVQAHATIYDSLYFYVSEDPETIKWVNDNLTDIMAVRYLKDEAVHNEAAGEIGMSWGELTDIENNASVEEIKDLLTKIGEVNEER